MTDQPTSSPFEDDSPFTVTDPDLDLHGVTIDSITRLGNEFMVTMSGGSGIMLDSNSLTMVEVDTIEEVTGMFGWQRTRDIGAETVRTVEANRMETKLTAWRVNKTPLRLLSEMGRSMYLIEDDDNWTALPRSAPQPD